ncbi:hypothetical protein [Paraliobacillus ryukyuensis]|uniref:hypothetical protein n=1 Tax=Paraliobacillus ryukyuensis TaxID=200904 RepID=UPI0009A82FF1|nr:hypothetical protein [Paraliobacillus ryukyuensis]
MQKTIENVKSLFEKYGDSLKTDKHLILMYLKTYEGLRFDSKYISTQDFINSKTDIDEIISAKIMYEIQEEELE